MEGLIFGILRDIKNQQVHSDKSVRGSVSSSCRPGSVQ